MNTNIYKLLGIALLTLSAGVLAVDETNDVATPANDQTLQGTSNSGQTAAEMQKEAEERAQADIRVAKLKAAMEAKAEAARLKTEQKAKATTEAQEKKAALAKAKQQAADAKAARLKADSETKAEADAKAADEAQAREAADAPARQAAAEETARQTAEAKAAEEARAQALADAKVAKLKAQQEAKAEAARVKTEQKAKAAADAQAKKEALTAAKKQAAEEKAAKLKTEQDAKAETERAKAAQDAKIAAEENAHREAAAQAEAARLKAEDEALSPMREKAAKFASWKEIENHLQANGVHLVMNPKDAEHLFHKDPTDKSSFPVKFVDGDITLNGRVTVKGSFTRNFLKKSLIVKFDNGATWHGQDRISLDAMATDVTEAHQWLAHDLMARMKMAAPEMLFTNLDINDKRIGRYLMVEWIKPSMFERFGLGADGELYNPEDTYFCGNFQPEDMKRLEKCFSRLDGGHDFSRLKKLAQELDAIPVEKFDDYLNKNFDSDSVINWLVINTLTGSEDTYNKNYFLYYSNLTQKWTLVPWDYDMAFGRVADLGVAYPRTIFNTGFQYLHSPESGAPSPLKEKTLKNAVLYKRYLAKVNDLFADVPLQADSYKGWYNPKNFSRMIEQKRAETHASIVTEMYPNPDKSDFNYMYDGLRFFNEWRYQYLNKLMLVPSVWNTPIWLPYKSFDPLQPLEADFYAKRHREPMTLVTSRDVKETGKRIFFVDPMLGIPLLAMDTVSISKPSHFDVQVSFQQDPVALPEGINAEECLEHTWHISNRTPDSEVKANLEIEYINEGSTRHELGDKIKSELGLTIWSNFDGKWLPLDSQINPRSNSFIVNNIVLDTGSYTLVACVDREKEAIAIANKNRGAKTGKTSGQQTRIDKQLKAQSTESEPAATAEPAAAVIAPPPVKTPDTKTADEAPAQTDAKVAKLQAAREAKAEAARLKAEQKAKAAAAAQEKKAAAAKAKQEAADAKAAQLKADSEAKAEAERVKAEADAKAAAEAQAREAADTSAKQAAADVAARQAADAKAADETRAQAEADAKVAKLQAAREAKAEAARLKAEQKAKAAAATQEKKAAAAKAKQDAADAKAAQFKADSEAKADAERVKAEADAKAAAEAPAAEATVASPVNQPDAEAAARAAADARVAKLKARMKASDAKLKAERDAKSPGAPAQ
ncbi:MAG: CotH kinase family protein [Proteobacteria bacterium]|nr:CotH kinase family protein [Pseudomonadota bacterium]